MAALWEQKLDLQNEIKEIMRERINRWDTDMLKQKLALVHGAYTKRMTLSELQEMVSVLRKAEQDNEPSP